MDNLTELKFDLIVIGAGGAGLMSAISAAKNGVKNIAVISKVSPLQSHTVAAKGGINAALGNVSKDDWQWHAFDTIKGGDFLADTDSVEILCKNAKDAIIDLEKIGVTFSRERDGKISQRPYGGQVTEFGKGGMAYRACYSKDNTGHTILYSLYQQCLKYNIKFFGEYFVTDILIDNNIDSKCYGAMAVDINNGELVAFRSPFVILAMGGYSQIFRNTTSSAICTGDGNALVFKEGLPLQDMEFIQFHPTGIAGYGFLITEAARSEGAYLLNSLGDRFMRNYAPKMMELASRDVISIAMATEIKEGRGCGLNKDYLLLDLRHIKQDIIDSRLPGVKELVSNFVKVNQENLTPNLIPVAPSAHYTMGGVVVDNDCYVLDMNEKRVEGLLTVGENMCISVHGANRLGCNSLLDLIVFGKIAGEVVKREAVKNKDINDVESILDKNIYKKILIKKINDFRKLFEKGSTENIDKIRTELQKINETCLGVFRDEELLKQGKENLLKLYKKFKTIKISNSSLMWNNDLINFLETENLFLNSFASFEAAIMRKESRGAHYRNDYKEKDDVNFYNHSLVFSEKGDVEKINYLKKRVRNNSNIVELNNILTQQRKY